MKSVFVMAVVLGAFAGEAYAQSDRYFACTGTFRETDGRFKPEIEQGVEFFLTIDFNRNRHLKESPGEASYWRKIVRIEGSKIVLQESREGDYAYATDQSVYEAYDLNSYNYEYRKSGSRIPYQTIEATCLHR